MTSYVALLRGINVGGNKLVAMTELREMLTALGFKDVKTLLQSGNAVFRGPARAPAKLEQQLEDAMTRHFDMSCDYHVRSASEWHEAIEGNPLKAEAAREPSRFLVTFYRESIDPSAVSALQKAIEGPEVVRSVGRQLYMYYPDGIGNSKASIMAGRMLKAKGTGRNWNTVLKLAALLDA